jgi:poly(A) polymerase
VCSYQLPDDLFTQGETKPVKKKKNKGGKAAPADTADKKRSFNNTGLDVSICQVVLMLLLVQPFWYRADQNSSDSQENQDPAKRRQSGTTPGAAAKPNGNAVPNGAAG